MPKTQNPKPLHVQVFAKFTLKNPPPEHRGLCSESFIFGQHSDKPFHALAYMMIEDLADFWFNAHPEVPEDAMLAELARLSVVVAGMRLEKKKEEPATDG